MDLNESFHYNLIKNHIDSFGVIAQSDKDGGDTFQREGMIFLIMREFYRQGKISIMEYLSWKDRYESILEKLKISPGHFKRHPDQSKWYGQPDRMSRDQWIPNAIMFGYLKNNHNQHYLKGMFKEHLLKRGLLLTTNTIPNGPMPGDKDYKRKIPDLTAFASWGIYIRSFDCGYLQLFLWLFDLDLLLNSLMWAFKMFFMKKDVDILNHYNVLIQAKDRIPTPISWMARKLMYLMRSKVQRSFDVYFRPESHAPPFNLLIAEILEESLK